MKLHLPSGLRAAVLACFAVVSPVAVSPISATMAGGAVAVTFLCSASSAMADSVQWDANWDIPDAPAEIPADNDISDIASGFSFLSKQGSPYFDTTAGKTIVLLASTAADATNVNVVAGAGMTTTDTSVSEGALTADTWVRVAGGTYATLVGGNYAQNYSGGAAANFTGDTHIMLEADATAGTSPAVDYIIGGNYMDSRNATFTGNSYISIESGAVNGSIVGASTSGHNQTAAFYGNSGVWVYTLLTTSADARFNMPANLIVGGNAGIANSNPKVLQVGDSRVTVDFSSSSTSEAYATAAMEKIIIGDAWMQSGGVTTHTGNAEVSINGADAADANISFLNAVVAGSWLAGSGTATLNGNTVLTITDGSFAGPLVGGAYLASGTSTASSTISGSSTITLGGNITTGVDAMVIGGSYVNASAGAVSSGSHSLTINGGSYAGNIIGGSYITSGYGEATQTVGDISLTMNDGTVSGTLYGGSYTARDNTESVSTHGAISISLAGGTVEGNVYAGGGVAADVQGSIIAASTQVEIADAATLGSITISGGIENANEGSSVTGDSTLVLSGSSNANLANATFESFNVVSNASAATINLAGARSGSFTKEGAGALTLSGGADALQAVSSVSVEGGSLDTGASTLTQGGTGLSSVSVAESSLLTTSALTLAEGASLALGLSSTAVSQALVAVTGELSLLGQTPLTLTLSGVTNLAAGDNVSLLSWGNADAPLTLAMVSWEKGEGEEAYELGIEGSSLVLRHAEELEWSNGSGEWNATTDWDGQTGTASDGKAVTFSTPAEAESTVTISGDVAPQSIVVNNGADTTYTFESDGTGAIAGTTSLTKENEGTLVLALGNTYTGGTTINGGTLEAAAANALGTGAVTVNAGGTLLASVEDAVAANAIAVNGGTLSYTEDEVRDLATAAVTNGTDAALAISVADDSTVNWESATAAPMVAAVGKGLSLSGGGLMEVEVTGADAALVLSGPITLTDDDTTLELNVAGAMQLGSEAAPVAISLEDGTTLSVALPQAGVTSVDAALSGEGTLEFTAEDAATTGAVQLRGNNSGFAGEINLGEDPDEDSPVALVAGEPSVLLDYSQGSPVGGADSDLNLNGLSFALVQSNGSTTVTAADIYVNSDTTQYAQTSGLENTFSGDVDGDEGDTWTLDTTLVDGGQVNRLTGDLLDMDGTFAATGAEGSLARWIFGGEGAEENDSIDADFSADNAYNEFVFDYAGEVELTGNVGGLANLTQQGAGTLTLTGESDSSGTLTIAAGSTVQLGDELDDGQWGSASGSGLAGNGTFSLVNGKIGGLLTVADGASPVVNVAVGDELSVDMGGNAGSLITGSFTMGEGATLTNVGSSILDKELNLTLAGENIGEGTAATAMVQFADTGTNVRAVTASLGSTTAAINLDASATEVVELLRRHRVEDVSSYLTLTNGQLVTAADYSNVNFGQNMDILDELGLRVSAVDGGSLVLSGAAQGVYIAGEGEDPTTVTGYQNFGAYQAVAVMAGETLTLNLDGAPDAELDGAGATVHNLLGAENSAFVVNNTDSSGEVAIVILDNSVQSISPIPSGLPGDPQGANTTFAGSVGESAEGGDVNFIKTGAGTLTLGGSMVAHQLTAQEGTITLNGSANSLDALWLAGGRVEFNAGTTTTASLLDDEDGGQVSIASGATLVVTGTVGALEDASIEGPGTLRIEGELALADDARLSGVALELADGTLALAEGSVPSVSSLNGAGNISGTGSANYTGLEITGTGGLFSGGLEGNGTLTVASGAGQAFSGSFRGGAGWSLVNNGNMLLDFVINSRANAPLSLDALTLGAGSATWLNLDLSLPTAGAITLGSISVDPTAAVNVSTLPTDNIVKADTSYTIGSVTGGQSAGVLATISPEASGIVLMLVDTERSTLSVDENGNLLLNLVTSRTNNLSALADNSNSAAGADMLWDAAFNGNTAVGTDIRRLLERLYTGTPDADRILAAASGASATVLSSAFASDVERQLRAIRNRSAQLPSAARVAPCKGALAADGPRMGAWINAEGDHRKMKADGFMPGYSLRSWGGTVGMDVSWSENTAAGLALTAMYGDLDARSADHATGDFDRYYISLFGKVKQQRWQHTLLGSVGRLDAKLDRTVSFGAGSYHTHGSTKGWGYGLMYEIGYDIPMDEGARFTLQPVANVTWRYVDVDGYTERGSDAGLRVGSQDYNVVTFGAGLRTQGEVGNQWFNRTALLEARALVKVDTGDRSADAHVAMLGGGGLSPKVRSAKLSAVGVELGAGLTVPLGDDCGSLFIDGSAELRNEYSNLNGTIGYRVEF